MGEMTIREKPILFSGPMVRAILEGRKFQTRRVVKGNFAPDQFIREKSGQGYGWHWPNWKGKENVWTMTGAVKFARDAGFDVQMKCPYGKPGDRLWVRETWGLFDTEPKDGPERAHVYYRASDGNLHECRYQLWRPSIHMPRWASRILLEITDLRAERVQDISEQDAIAEGCFKLPATGRITDVQGGQYAGRVWPRARDWYGELWDELNADRGYGWNLNPWVWAITFRRIDA